MRATRRVASEVKLSTYALIGTPVDAIQLPADSHPQLSLLFREQGGGKVSGHVAGFTGLPIDPDTSRVTTGAPGDTTLAAVGQPAIAPLALRVIDPATSVATIAQLTANSGATSLTVYTQDFDSMSFVLEAFDADGYLALPGLSVAATGPNLAPGQRVPERRVRHRRLLLPAPVAARRHERARHLRRARGRHRRSAHSGHDHPREPLTMRVALLGLLLACATPTSPCGIETVVATRIGSAQVMDCGHLDLDATDAMRSSTQSCVLAADVNQQPYVAEWQIQGIDSRIADAFLGLDTPAGWHSVGFSHIEVTLERQCFPARAPCIARTSSSRRSVWIRRKRCA